MSSEPPSCNAARGSPPLNAPALEHLARNRTLSSPRGGEVLRPRLRPGSAGLAVWRCSAGAAHVVVRRRRNAVVRYACMGRFRASWLGRRFNYARIGVMKGSSFVERILAHGLDDPDWIIVVDRGREITARDFRKLVLGLARALQETWLGAGGRVAVVPTVSAEALAVRYAAGLLGCASVFCPNTGVPGRLRTSPRVLGLTRSSCSPGPPTRRVRSWGRAAAGSFGRRGRRRDRFA